MELFVVLDHRTDFRQRKEFDFLDFLRIWSERAVAERAEYSEHLPEPAVFVRENIFPEELHARVGPKFFHAFATSSLLERLAGVHVAACRSDPMMRAKRDVRALLQQHLAVFIENQKMSYPVQKLALIDLVARRTADDFIVFADDI